MNASPVRGVAVLALLCLLPRASALTITQTITQAVSGGYHGTGTGVNGVALYWPIEPFNSFLGSLQSVTLSLSMDFTVAVSEANPFSYAMNWVPSVSLRAEVYTPDGLRTALQDIGRASGPLEVIAPYQSSRFTGDADISTQLVFTSTGSLAAFRGAAPQVGIVSYYSGNESNGDVTATGTISASVIYNYSVADTLSVSAWFGATMLGVFALHRRRVF